MKLSIVKCFSICIGVVAFVCSWLVSLSLAEKDRGQVVASHVQDKVPAQMNRGWIDAVKDHEIVIDDMTYPVASMKIYDHKGLAKGKSSLIVGRRVAFKRAEQGGTVVYLLNDMGQRPQKMEPSTAPRDSISKGKKSPIRQVDGVWKN